MLRLDINIVWTILNLLIIFAIVKIFLIKPIHKILDARQAEIDKQYADAKAAQDSANELKGQYEASLSGVQAEKESSERAFCEWKFRIVIRKLESET